MRAREERSSGAERERMFRTGEERSAQRHPNDQELNHDVTPSGRTVELTTRQVERGR